VVRFHLGVPVIKIKHQRDEIIEGQCDQCGQDLMLNQDGNANFGVLRSNFGWPSKLDQIGQKADEFHLCALCWVNCIEALGLLKNSELLVAIKLNELAQRRPREKHLAYF
jgi:hypothetical protein